MVRSLAAAAALVFASMSCGVGSPWFKTPDKYWSEIHEKYIADHPETSDVVKAAIRAGEIIRGMTELEVVASIGKPYNINRSTFEWGTTAQFCYANPALYPVKPKYTFVYFENGKVSSWSQ
jgi:hypothetical protein